MPACDVSHTLPGTVRRALAKTGLGAVILGATRSSRAIRPDGWIARLDVDQMLT
jgi:hypothetical protein